MVDRKHQRTMGARRVTTASLFCKDIRTYVNGSTLMHAVRTMFPHAAFTAGVTADSVTVLGLGFVAGT